MIRIKYLDNNKEWVFMSASFSDIDKAKHYIEHTLISGYYDLYKETRSYELLEKVTKP